jgi:aspartyl-tRNA(Asn)/glutamyl-tRNA(Gln) amidotransferase subunit C
MQKTTLDVELVKKVAHLARLDISDASALAYSKQLSVIMEHIDKLSEVKVDGVEPLTHPNEGQGFRPDRVREKPVSTESVVATAPELAGSGYKVPPIL